MCRQGCPHQVAGGQDIVGARKPDFGLGQGEEEEEDVGERLKSWRLSSAC